MSLSCEACDALLIDLVERELDETKTAEVRAHADGCESCGRSLARLEGGRRAARELVRAEPPRLDAVMAAARARAAEVRAARAESVEPLAASAAAPTERETDDGWLAEALRWLGSFATRPQVAMAALLVLMVGIGLYNVPHFRSRDGADGALVEPDMHAEMGPSALEPAQPLELAVDPRTQRVALGAGEHTEAQAEARDQRPTTTLAVAADHSARAAARPTAATPGVATRTATATTEDALAVTDLAPSDTAGRVEEGPLPDVAAAPEQPAIVLAPSTTPSSSTRSSAPSVASRSAASPYREEVAPTTPSAAALLPAAILRQARALASAGHCDEAVPRYRTLLAEHPDDADAPRAMIELAECDRRLGRLDDAERWLVRAEAFPSVSAEARRERTRVATEQRAVDRAASTSGASATPPAASSY